MNYEEQDTNHNRYLHDVTAPTFDGVFIDWRDVP